MNNMLNPYLGFILNQEFWQNFNEFHKDKFKNIYGVINIQNKEKKM